MRRKGELRWHRWPHPRTDVSVGASFSAYNDPLSHATHDPRSTHEAMLTHVPEDTQRPTQKGRWPVLGTST